MHLIIVWSAHDIGRDFRQGGRGGIEPFATDGAPILIATDAGGVVEGDEQSRELQGDIGTYLVVALTRFVAHREVV